MHIPPPTYEACSALLRPYDRNLTAACIAARLAAGGATPLPKKYITIGEAAKLLDVEPRTIVNFFHRGMLRRIPLGNRLARVAVEDIDKLMAGRVKA